MRSGSTHAGGDVNAYPLAMTPTYAAWTPSASGSHREGEDQPRGPFGDVTQQILAHLAGGTVLCRARC